MTELFAMLTKFYVFIFQLLAVLSMTRCFIERRWKLQNRSLRIVQNLISDNVYRRSDY